LEGNNAVCGNRALALPAGSGDESGVAFEA